jgi:hypothetical protein
MAKPPAIRKLNLLTYVKAKIAEEVFKFTHYVPEYDEWIPPKEESPRAPEHIKWYRKKVTKLIHEDLKKQMKAVETYFADELFEDKGKWKKAWMIK